MMPNAKLYNRAYIQKKAGRTYSIKMIKKKTHPLKRRTKLTPKSLWFLTRRLGIIKT